MAYSTQTAVSDGSLSTLPLSIDYMSRDDISVSIDGVKLIGGWSWVGTTDKIITFDSPVPNGSVVVVKRRTAVATLYHEYSMGAQFTAKTFDESLRQTLLVAQESQEVSTEDFDVAPRPVGAVGDGITNDSAAFAALAVTYKGRYIDLSGKTYRVTSIPRDNVYVNGRWALSKSVTIGAAKDNYTYYAPAAVDAGQCPSVSPVALARSGLSSAISTYVRPDNHQGVAVDDVGNFVYLMYVAGSPEVTYVAQYDKFGGATLAVQNASSMIGHQGLALEQNQSSVPRLWSSVRADPVNYPNGHRQVVRFRFGGNAADPLSVELYTLFGPEYLYPTNSVMVAISYDQKYLVVMARKSSRDFWVRVFLLKDITEGGPGDYSNKWLYEWNVDREILADDGGDSSLGIASAFTPVQGIACDSGTVYILAGNSNLTPNRIHSYSLAGVRQSSNDRVSVGLTEAKAVAGGTEFEPEGLTFCRPDGVTSPVLCMSVQYGIHGSLTTSLFAFGYKGGLNTSAQRWTPTFTPVTNVTSASPYSCHYTRIGSEVHYAGRVNMKATAVGYCEVRMTFPVPSNISSLTDAVGTLTGIGFTGMTAQPDTGAIEGDTTNKTFVLKYYASDTQNRTFYFSGMMEVK